MVTQGGGGGTERNKKGRGQHRWRKQRDRRGRQQHRGKDRYACYYFLSLFLYFHLFFISLFFFSDYFFSDNYNKRWGTKGKRRTDGTPQTGPTGTSSSMYLSFWISSFILIILLLFRLSLFSVEYNNRRAGRDRWQRRTGRGTGEQAGTTGTSSVTVFLPTLLFSSSHFYYLFCRKL